MLHRLLSAIAAEADIRSMQFMMTDDLKEQVSLVSQWLCGYSKKNSLMLSGNCGNGKTTFVKAMQNMLNYLQIYDPTTNEQIGFGIFNARELASICKDDHAKWKNIISRDMLAVDDLGTEPREINVYGNILTPMMDLISLRYDRLLSTIFTSNLAPEQVSEWYGMRIADRLREVCENIPFMNRSYRSETFIKTC